MRPRTMIQTQGVVAIDKPAGITSFQVVSRVKRALKVKKAGHTGTLDPAATGLLVVCVGRATRLAQFITQGDKVYEGTFTLGITTDTYDEEGSVVSRAPVPKELDFKALEQAAAALTGTIAQAPPPFSAAKHNGVPLYKLARKGIEIKKAPREVEIFSFDINEVNLPKVSFRINCSKGTYIRSIAHDFGRILGCGAVLSELRRTRSGHMRVEDALDLDAFDRLVQEGRLDQVLQPVDTALSHVPGIVVNSRDALKLVQGQGMTTSRLKDYITEQAPILFQARPEVLRILAPGRGGSHVLVGLVAWPESDFTLPALVKVMRIWSEPADISTKPAGHAAALKAQGTGPEQDKEKILIS